MTVEIRAQGASICPYQRVLIAPSMSEQLQECTSIHKLPPSLILLLFDTPFPLAVT